MTGIAKRVYVLADSRELIYFDDVDTTQPPERAPDLRDLGVRPPTAEMRQDPLTGEWIAVTPARQDRVVMPPVGLDPLAPQAPGNPSEIPSDYDVAVFENRSPAFGPGLPDPGSAQADPAYLSGPAVDGPALGRAVPAYGRCEVICFSSAREGAFGSISRSRARTVIEAWADRTAALSSLPGIAQVYIFENRGAEIGVTLQHPHGQIYGYPYLPPRTRQLLAQIDAYGPALFADILKAEREGPRVLLAGQHWTAFAWCRTSTSLTSPPLARRSGTSSPSCTCDCCAAWTPSTTTPPPTSPHGTRRPCERTVIPRGCTCG
jgi:UDPglucose--hexose-1-phosphate uridylyltransferase